MNVLWYVMVGSPALFPDFKEEEEGEEEEEEEEKAVLRFWGVMAVGCPTPPDFQDSAW